MKFNTVVNPVPAAESSNAVLDGRFDSGLQWIPMIDGTFPLWNFASLPMFFQDSPVEYERAMNDARLIKILDEDYLSKGLKRLCAVNSATIDVIGSNKPLAKLDDFKGLKIRVIGSLPTMTLKLMGASPLVIPLGEVPDALRLGTVDAISTGITYGLGSFGMADNAAYLNYWLIQSEYPGALIVNLKKWNALPDDLKPIVLKTAMDFQSQQLLSVYVHNLTARADVAGTKMKLITPDKAEVNKAGAATKPVVDEWLKVSGPKAQDILAIIKQYGTGPLAK